MSEAGAGRGGKLTVGPPVKDGPPFGERSGQRAARLSKKPQTWADPLRLCELFSLGMEVPDQLDRVLTRGFRPRNRV